MQRDALTEPVRAGQTVIAPECIVGLDSGGSKTIAWCVTPEGEFLAEEVGGANNLVAHGPSEAGERISHVASRCASQAGFPHDTPIVLSIGTAGAGREKEVKQFAREVSRRFPRAAVLVDHDAAIACYGAHGAARGVILIAGTGAIAWGVSREAGRIRVDGWGAVGGDEGGGFWIGVETLRRVYRAADGRRKPFSLANAVFDHFGVADAIGLSRSIPLDAESRKRVAALAGLVCRAAEDGNEEACAILEGAADHLAQAASVLARAMTKSSNEKMPVSWAGGLLSNSELFRALVGRKLIAHNQAAEWTAPKLPPVGGAIVQAFLSLQMDSPEERVERLLRSVRVKSAS